MDRCKELRSQLVAYVDGELGSAESEEVAQHIEGCLDCKAEITELAILHRQLRAGKDVEPSRGFDAALRGKLAAQTMRTFPALFPVAVAASLLIGVFIGGGMLYNTQPRSSLGTHLSLELASFGAAPPNSLQVHYRSFVETLR